MKRILLILVVALSFGLGSCHMIKDCNCPKFGQKEPKEQKQEAEAIVAAPVADKAR